MSTEQISHEPKPQKFTRPNGFVSMACIYLYVGICAAEETVDAARAWWQERQILNSGGEPHQTVVCDPDGRKITKVSEG